MSALLRLTISEARLFSREPLEWGFALVAPPLLLVILGVIPSFRVHQEHLGGLRIIDLYAPILVALAITVLALLTLPQRFATYRDKKILRRMRITPSQTSALALRAIDSMPVCLLHQHGHNPCYRVFGLRGAPPAKPSRIHCLVWLGGVDDALPGASGSLAGSKRAGCRSTWDGIVLPFTFPRGLVDSPGFDARWTLGNQRLLSPGRGHADIAGCHGRQLAAAAACRSTHRLVHRMRDACRTMLSMGIAMTSNFQTHPGLAGALPYRLTERTPHVTKAAR